jgi:hypothetical protein
MKRVAISLGVVLFAFALGGCGIVVSEHPASDSSTHVLDEDLIGLWQLVDMEHPEEKAKQWALIGRRADTLNELEIGGLELTGDEHIDVGRLLLFTTRIGDRWYMSVVDESENEKVFLIMLYAHADAKTAALYGLENEAVKKAVESKQVSGRIIPAKSEGGSDEIVLEAKTPELRAWLEKVGASVFGKEHAFELRRVE